jgi:hypothetical protein
MTGLLGNIKYKHVINNKHIINKQSFSFPITHLCYSITLTPPCHHHSTAPTIVQPRPPLAFNRTHHCSMPLHEPISTHDFRWHTVKMVMMQEVGAMSLTAMWQPTQTKDEDDKQTTRMTNN